MGNNIYKVNQFYTKNLLLASIMVWEKDKVRLCLYNWLAFSIFLEKKND